MKKYSKYIISFFIVVVAYLISFVLIIQVSASPNGPSTDLSYISSEINLIISVIIGCTSLVIFTIKSSKKHD